MDLLEGYRGEKVPDSLLQLHFLVGGCAAASVGCKVLLSCQDCEGAL